MPPAKEEMPSTANSMVAPSRRVVKAKTPPPPSSSSLTSSLTIVSDNVDITTNGKKEEEELDVAAHVSYAMGSPSVARELEQEKANMWRQERLDSGVAKQKMERDKEFSERRQSASGSTGSTPQPTSSRDAAATAAATTEESDVLQERFSVEPKFPEHKRSGDTISGISDGEPEGKRRKSSVDDDADGSKETDAIVAATRVVVVTAALAAVVAIGFAIFRRSTGGGRG